MQVLSIQIESHSNQKDEKSFRNMASNYPGWKQSDYLINRGFVIFAKDSKEAHVAARRRCSDYPRWTISDYPIGRNCVDFCQGLKEASVAARRRGSDYPISIGSDYPIPLISTGFHEDKRRTQCCSSQKVPGLSELDQLGLSDRRIIRWSLTSDYPTFLPATATFWGGV